MRLTLAILCAAALPLAACADNSPGGKAAHARHENFEAMGEAFKKATDQLKEKTPDFALVRTEADKLRTLGAQLDTWFPAGSGPQDGVKTEALAAVWQKPDEFRAANAKFQAEAANFATAAAGGDAAVIGKAAQALGATCKGCHDKFREPE